MTTDTFTASIDEIVLLLKSYKPGAVTLDNVMKLCQTVGLESYTDDVDAETCRLSTASQIIVVDIDFGKSDSRVKDVKLVLASNFDDFHYFNDSLPAGENNILLRSLTMYSDLKQFHHNLRYLHLLDTCSSVEIDPANTSINASSHDQGLKSIAGSQGNSADASTTTLAQGNTIASTLANPGTLDLFKYSTDLKKHITNYLQDSGSKLVVKANLHDKFGIYLLRDGVPEARVYIAQSAKSDFRLYEYVYSTDTQSWQNEHSERFTTGVTLILELIDDSIMVPQDFIAADLIPNLNISEENYMTRSKVEKEQHIIDLHHNINHNSKLRLLNDFTTELVRIYQFELANDNLDLILEILNWVSWYKNVLQVIFEYTAAPAEPTLPEGVRSSNTDTDNHLSNGIAANVKLDYTTTVRDSAGAAESFKRRRSSSRSKRPSIHDSTMLNDEGMQHYNLHEIMAQPVLVEEDAMDVDDKEVIDLILSEDHVSLGKVISCSLYDSFEKWQEFMKEFRNCAQAQSL